MCSQDRPEEPQRADRPKTQRLFFALWPDDDQRRLIRRHCKSLLRHGGGRPVATENLHVTLAFLGPVTADQRACVERAADAIRLPPFELNLDHAAHWPRPRVLWVGPSEQPPALLALAAALHQAATACGLKLDARPYQAHLTLMRKVARAPADLAIRPFRWPVRGFVLVESKTLAEGVRYTPLKSWPLVEDSRPQG